MHIAICDDRFDVLAAIDDILQSATFSEICGGIDATAAFTETDAFLKHIASTPTDIAIIDIMLADSANGIDLAKRINREHPGMSIIFISGSADYYEKVYEANHCYFL